MDENYPRENQTGETDAKGRQWMTVEELEGYAELTRNVAFLKNLLEGI